MANEPDISAFCPQDGDLPPTVRALFHPDASERRSAPELSSELSAANDKGRAPLSGYLVVGRRVAFLMQRREVEGRIEAMNLSTGEADVRLTTAPFTGQLHFERLAHLVPIDANGDPLGDPS
ncbi:MAG: hypothetical protein CMF76_09345 [Maricaulis sp.]|nr:hypothetical protein [Oceanicaulis sp.]MAZ92152.1 hypothetical protein [Maricaulis sp.]